MSLDIIIKDGKGRGYTAAVDENSDLSVINRGIPPKDAQSEIRIFRQFFTLDGSSTGNSDMRTTGTLASTVQYFIRAPSDADRYIDSINFVIADAGASMDEFGAVTALTNGCKLFYEDPELGDVIIHEALKSSFDFIRLCQGRQGFGTSASAFRANNVVGSSEAYFPTLDFSDAFGIPWGVRLPKDSTLRIVFEVRDTTTGVDGFNAIAYGYDRIIPD